MDRYGPGIYHIVNTHGSNEAEYNLDNMRFQIIDNCTVTVIVKNNLNVVSGNIYLSIKKVGQIGDISGNATKWKD
tara:strand:+ start:135 stop:359 length:225 start_codon:yes stop_codon:yes gene_type:complete